jgi:chromosomal replication initiation ATPase DnaA
MIVDFDLLVREAADVFGVTPEDILGPKRTKHVSMARHVVMACWSDYHPYQDTANRCNRTCHSTVIWARQRILNQAEMNVSFAKMLTNISSRCQYGAEQEPEKKEKQIEILA